MRLGLGSVAHSYNPSTLESQGRWITWDQEFETRLANMVKSFLYKKYKNYLCMVAGICSFSYFRGWGRRIAWTWEAKVAASQDCLIALQPEWQNWDFIKNKKNSTKEELKETPWTQRRPYIKPTTNILSGENYKLFLWSREPSKHAFTTSISHTTGSSGQSN